MDRHSFCNSSMGIRCYCPSMYIRHNETFWAKVGLWDTFEKGICGQVCLGLESPLIFKPESDADNSCPFSASWTGCGHEVSRGPGCSGIAWFLRSLSRLMNPVIDVLVADAGVQPEVVNFLVSWFSWGLGEKE